MNLLPTEQDRTPLQTRFWVQSSGENLTYADSEEGQDSVEARLRSDFPIYRVIMTGKTALKKVMGL